MKQSLILFLFVILIYPFAGAQSFYNNGSIMVIGQGVDFTVKDSLVNKGTLTNNGNMVMGGVWLNQGTYFPGTGEITFNSITGSDAQIINHNSQSFGKLTISGGGEKIILADMTIEGELVLTDGVITQQNNSQVLFESSAIVTGGSDQSHINAAVVQQGSGQKTFPLGNGTTYLPVVLNNTNNVNVRVESIEDAQNLQPGFDLESIVADRYWKFEPLSGDLSGTTISLPLKTSQVLSITSSLVVAQSENIGSDFRSIGQSNFTGTETNGVLTSAQAPTFSLLAIAVASTEAGGIIVFNAVSPNSDDMNDYFMIGNIDLFPANLVKIFNRWGDKVYEKKGYNNTDIIFVGKSNQGGAQELPSGVYFYSINKGDGSEAITGYLSLKR